METSTLEEVTAEDRVWVRSSSILGLDTVAIGVKVWDITCFVPVYKRLFDRVRLQALLAEDT